MPTISNLTVTPTSADRYWSDNLTYLPLTLSSDSKEIYNETDSSYDLVDSIFTRNDYTGRETFTQNPGKNTSGSDYTLGYNTITSGKSFSNPNATIFNYVDVTNQLPTTLNKESIGVSFWLKTDSTNYSGSGTEYILALFDSDAVTLTIDQLDTGGDSIVRVIISDQSGPPYPSKSIVTTPFTFDTWEHYYIYVEDLTVTGGISAFRNGVDCVNLTGTNVTSAMPPLSVMESASLTSLNGFLNGPSEISDVYLSTNSTFKDYLNNFYTNNIPTLSDTNLLEIIDNGDLTSDKYLLASDEVSGASSNLLDLDHNNSCNPKPIGHVFVGNNGYLDMSSKVPALSGETFFGVSMRLRLPKEAENYDDPGYDYPRFRILSLQNPGLGADNAILDITYTYNFTSATGFIEAISNETSGSFDKINVATIGEEIPNPVTSAGPNILEFNHLFVYIDYNDGNNGDINIYLNGVKQTGIFGGINGSALSAFPQNPAAWYLNATDLGSGVVSADLGCQISDLYWSTDPSFKDRVSEYYDFPVITFDDQVVSEPISAVSDSDVRIRLTDDTLEPGIYNITTTQSATSGDVDFEIVATNVVEIKTTGREKGTFFNNQLDVTGRYFTAATFTFNGEEITPLGFNDTSALLEIPDLPPGTYTLSANPT